MSQLSLKYSGYVADGKFFIRFLQYPDESDRVRGRAAITCQVKDILNVLLDFDICNVPTSRACKQTLVVCLTPTFEDAHSFSYEKLTKLWYYRDQFFLFKSMYLQKLQRRFDAEGLMTAPPM